MSEQQNDEAEQCYFHRGLDSGLRTGIGSDRDERREHTQREGGGEGETGCMREGNEGRG